MMSDTCGASSNAATRGMRSLPNVVDGAKTCVNPVAVSATCGASVAASACSFAAWVTSMTRATPDNFAASPATGDPAVANTAIVTSAPASVAAAVTHLAV